MTTHDKYGTEIRKGDEVEAVHFGEHHIFTVSHITENSGTHHVHGKVEIAVPAGATSKLLRKGKPDHDAHETEPVEPHTNAAGAPTHHTSTTQPPKQRILRRKAK